MLAARACLLKCAGLGSSLTRQTLVAKVPNQGFIRHFGNETRFRGRVRSTEIPIARKVEVKTQPFTFGQGAVAGGAAIGMGALVYYGLGLSSESGTLEQSYLWPQYVKDRVHDSYMYLAGSLGLTAASTVAVYRTPFILKLFNIQGFMGMIVPFIALVAVGSALHSIKYEPGVGPKQMMWALHSSLVGAVIAPLMILGGPLLVRAACLTAGVVGGLSTVALCAPSDKFLNMGAPLGIGFGVVLASSFGSMFMPPTSMLGASMHSMALYGGVLLFSMMMLYQTQRLMHNAQHTSPYHQFDPINESTGLYMSIINLFVRMVQMMAMNKRK